MNALKYAISFAVLLSAMQPAMAAAPPTNATFLGFRFIPNAEPITPQEQARLEAIESSYIQKLEHAEKYAFVKVPDGMRRRIAAGQPVGECAGCEIDYGKELGVPVVMWGTVQKVSNLILNLNVYMADVEQRKMLFVKSVDMRGNTDETWQQALNYMVKRYIIKSASVQGNK